MNPPDQHPTGGLDDTVHQRVRLGILTLLIELRRADFSYLKQALELSDGNLNRHLSILAAEQLVAINKEPDGGRTRTWIALTKTGQNALAEEMRALGELVRRFETANATIRRPAPRTGPAIA